MILTEGEVHESELYTLLGAGIVQIVSSGRVSTPKPAVHNRPGN